MISRLKTFLREGPVYLQGFIGSGLILISFLVAALPFSDRLGRSYSIFTFFVSELGEMGRSVLAPVFNTGLFLGGLALLAFMTGLRRYFMSPAGRLGVITGTLSAACAAMVGVLPMNILYPHFAVAMGFFYGGMVTVFLFTAAIMNGDGASFPRWTAVPGIAVLFAFGLFHFATTGTFNFRTIFSIRDFIDIVPIIRPHSFWAMAFYEWLAVLAMNAWVIMMSLIMWRKKAGE
jgi:hypothetical protein